MEIETMTMTEKLLVVRSMIDRGELLVSIGYGEAMKNKPECLGMNNDIKSV